LAFQQRPIGRAGGLQSCGLGKVHAEPIATALVASGHLGRSMSELLLDVTFIHLGAAGETCAQGMAGEELQPLGFGKFGPQTRIFDGLLDEARDMLV